MKIKSTFLILFISIWVNQFYGQFTPQKPDLRNCGSAPNYYLDYFNCTSNNYTLDDVFLSISNSSGVPITTPCAPPNVQNVFLWLNYTSNSNSSIHQTRIFADILVKDQNGNLIQTLQINSYLGEVVPGSGQRLLNIPGYGSGFPWTCGYQLSLTKLLVVWKTNGNSSDPELSTYNCGTYNKSQCELPTSMIVSAPMAVQFEYTQCTIGNTTTVNFDDDTNGGEPPYAYLWNFGDGSPTSNLQNPSHTYPYPGGPYTVTLQVTDSSSPTQVSTSVQIINLINPINITGNVNSSPCSSGNIGAIDVSVSGGTPGYTYLWSNGATSQDLTGLANGSYTVTVTDSVGCTAQQTFIITGGDTTPPVVTAPANLTLEGCNTSILGISGYFPFSLTISTITQAQFILAGGTIFDASAISSVTYIDTVLGTCPRVVSRLFTLADACNNSTQVTQTFTIQDTTDPTISTQASNSTVECDGAGNTAALAAWLASNGGAVSSDVCSSVTWSNNYSGSLSDLCGMTGSATVIFTATDACGNSSTSSGTFTIQDTTDPTISTQASNSTVECDGAGNLTELNAWLASNGGAVSSDVCSSVTWSNNYSGSLSDLCGMTGSATVIFTATDACGNSSTSSGTFTIQDNIKPLIITNANNITVECDGAGNVQELAAWLASNGGTTASDNCSEVSWSNNYSGSFSDDCGLTGAVTVLFTATDACGNFSESTGIFTIQDTTDPSLITQASSQTVECDGQGNTQELAAWLASNGGASVSDICSGVTWTNSYNEQSFSDDCGLTGSATVTFTATDACGNSSTSSGTFTIQDTTDPVFTSELPQNISVSCDAIPVPQELTGVDSCSSQITITTNDDIVENEGACTGQFTILRTWTITDSCGNDLSYTQTISVYDNTAPTLVTQLSTEVDAICSEIPPKPNLEFTDNCSGVDPNIVYTETTTIISIYQYVIVREWTVSDNCGNDASFSQTINVSVGDPFDAIPFTMCYYETVDLFTLLPDNLPQNGTWVEVNSSGALSGSIFNPANLAYGYYTIRYIVSVENNPCPMIYEIYVQVDECEVLAECDIVVFNAVSPNGDGLNEVFTIGGILCFPNNTVEIYNRWGVNVYKAQGYNNSSVSFDGQSQNKLTVGNDKLPGDTYFYILKYNDSDNNSFEKTGYLYVKY